MRIRLVAISLLVLGASWAATPVKAAQLIYVATGELLALQQIWRVEATEQCGY